MTYILIKFLCHSRVAIIKRKGRKTPRRIVVGCSLVEKELHEPAEHRRHENDHIQAYHLESHDLRKVLSRAGKPGDRVQTFGGRGENGVCHVHVRNMWHTTKATPSPARRRMTVLRTMTGTGL